MKSRAAADESAMHQHNPSVSPLEPEIFAATTTRCFELSEKLGRLAGLYLGSATNGRLLRHHAEKTVVLMRRDLSRRELGTIFETMCAVMREEFGINGVEVHTAAY